jgi:hypothetical protein
MWCGIAAIVLAGLTVIENYGLVCSYGFLVWVFIVALATGGLIYTFRSRKAKNINIIQEVRDNILRKRRSKMEKNDDNKDK